MNEAFKKTHSQFGLSLELTTEWIETLFKFNKQAEALEQIKSGLVKYKEAASLWKLYLTIKIEETNDSNKEELIELFNKSLKNIEPKNALDSWKLMINWCLLNNYETTEKILKEGSQVMSRDVATFSRMKYLNWGLQDPNRNEKLNGLNKVRKIYEG